MCAFYARKLKFGMLLTQTYIFSAVLVTPESCPEVGLGVKMYNIRLVFLQIVVEIYAFRYCCHMGNDQRAGAFLYFGHMSNLF